MDINFNEFRENISSLFEIISTKQKMKISNICISYKGIENYKTVKSLAKRARKEYNESLEKESFNNSLYDRNYGDPDYDYMSDIFELISIEDMMERRVNCILLSAITLLAYNLSNEKAEDLYNKIIDLGET